MYENPTLAVVGAGAMGSLFGGLLAEGGLDVTLVDVWQEHVDNINRDGLKIVGYGGDRFVPVKATTRPEALAPVDTVFVQCKAGYTRDSIASAANLIGDHTAVISFQNGLGNAELLAELIGEEKVLGGLTAQGASMDGPGIVRNYADLPSHIGEMRGGLSDRVTGLSQVFTKHGLQTEPSPDIRLDIWKKLMAVVGLDPTSGITNLPIGRVMAVPAMRETIFAAIDEAAAVGRKVGVAIDINEAREVLLQITGKGGTGENKSSLCNDILSCRQTEIDFINGAIVRLAAEHGVPTPVILDRDLRRYFRGDAAFASPDIYKFLEDEGFLYAIRLPKNQVLLESICHLLTRPVGRPPNHVRRHYAGFSYRAKSWDKARRVVAKVEWHPSELFPPGRVHRHQPVATGRAGDIVLQSAGQSGAMHQGRQERDQMDEAVVSQVPR